MGNDVIIDNWSLFDIKELLSAKHLNTKDELTLEDSELNTIVKQFITLLNFLVDLVSRDTILTTRGTQIAWIGKLKTLDQLVVEGIIEAIVDDKTKNDLEQIKIIKDGFNISGNYDKKSINELLLDHTIIDGTAEYLYRSSQSATFYSPHPDRADFLKNTMFPIILDGNQQIKNWIKSKRVNIVEKISNDQEFRVGLIPIDPFLVEIIENSSKPEDLFKYGITA